MQESNWAAEHLQVIRTLMERSALYRRALAPIMLLTGSMGLVAAVVSCFIKIESNRAFSLYWMSVGAVALAVSLWLVRRQAWKAKEPFWSPPTRRVTEALFPAFLVGFVTASALLIGGEQLPALTWLLALAWTVIYGYALHAAGFFLQRGIKLFGWAFLLGGCLCVYAFLFHPPLQTSEAGHYVMGIFFGLLHMAYGVYLYFTEKQKNAA